MSKALKTLGHHLDKYAPAERTVMEDLCAAFENSRAGSLFESLDAVNDKYGEFSVARARLQERTPGPRVISPSWRPGAPTPAGRIE